MLRRIVQLFFFIVGGVVGVLYLSDLLELLKIDDIPFLDKPYTLGLLGAIIFYILTFWLVDYCVGLIKWLEESLIKAPVTDVLFGSLGLIFGLIVAFLIVIPLDRIDFVVVNTVVPIFVTILLGYLGFQVGFKKRDELISLFSIKNIGKKKVEDEE